MKKILMIAFHYPPFGGSSSVHRTVSFARNLPDHGWEPIVLTANPVAYPPSQIRASNVDRPLYLVERAASLDTARHLSVGGRYLGWLALPDRWASWYFGVVYKGLRLVHEHEPDVIWSTVPIATAHLAALTLHRMTGIEWVADFRDPMTEEHFPRDLTTRRVHRWIERRTLAHCHVATFTTPGAKRLHVERYPGLPASRFGLIPNGYDEASFAGAEELRRPRPDLRNQLVLVHSGLLYRSQRDPRPFFDAIKKLRQSGKVTSANLKVILRASGDDAYYREALRERGIEDIVHLDAPRPYLESLAEMLDSDGLLVFQASSCNEQIPAKLYEYLRARRPILAMTDPRGDTAGVLREAGVGTIVRLDSADEIARGLSGFIDAIRASRAPIADDAEIARLSRRERTRQLVELLNSIPAKS